MYPIRDTYKELSDANKGRSHKTPKPGPVLGDNKLLERWFRFVGAAVTKIRTTRVPAYRCGTDRSSWLDGAHPSVEDDEVLRKVCFSNRLTGCKYPTEISVGYSQRNHSGIYIDVMVHFFRDFAQSSLRHNNFNDLNYLGRFSTLMTSPQTVQSRVLQ